MFIQNAAAVDVTHGTHRDAGFNSMLIQISDPVNGWIPAPKYKFKETYQLVFADAEGSDMSVPEDHKITDAQSWLLVNFLQHALDNRMNVIVHCVAGLCRSGAVAEVGVMMGFEDTGRVRQPNMLVKYKMMKVLEWTYD